MDTANNYMPSPGENSHAIQPTKEDLGRYIHDIAELEKRIFTIDKTIQDSRSQLNRTKQEVKKQAQSAKDAFEFAETALDNAKAKKKEALEVGTKDNNSYGLKKPVKKVVVEDTLFFGKRLTAAIFGFFIAVLGLGIGASIKMPIVILSSVALALFLFLMGVIKDKKRRKHYQKYVYPQECEKAEKDYQKAMEEYESERQNIIREAEELYNDREEAFAQATKEVLNIQVKLDAIDSWEKKFNEEIEKAVPQREMLTNQMHKLYSFNLIPPDYREVDCTMMFDQIFRNDLADNMREAVKIYEERVFRGDVIRGIDKIYGMLGQLNAGMMQIGRNLESVKERVSFMSHDLCSLVTLTEESVDNQRSIRRETELNRYAIESVKSSTENLEYYARKWK